jgi:hypothetical protein
MRRCRLRERVCYRSVICVSNRNECSIDDSIHRIRSRSVIGGSRTTKSVQYGKSIRLDDTDLAPSKCFDYANCTLILFCLKGKPNFFETRVSAYQKSGVALPINVDPMKTSGDATVTNNKYQFTTNEEF